MYVGTSVQCRADSARLGAGMKTFQVNSCMVHVRVRVLLLSRYCTSRVILYKLYICSRYVDQDVFMAQSNAARLPGCTVHDITASSRPTFLIMMSSETVEGLLSQL